MVPAIATWASKQVRDPDNEVLIYELTSSRNESVRLLIHAPQHDFIDFAPLGGERVTVRVSATRVVALSGSMTLAQGVVSGKVFVHLLSSEGGTNWLELETDGVQNDALADLVAALATAPTVPLDSTSRLWSDFCDEGRRVQILEGERVAAGDVIDEPTISGALTRLQGQRHWRSKCARGTYSLPRLVGWSVTQFRADGDCVGYELTGGGARSLLYACLLNPAIYHLPTAALEPTVRLSVDSRNSIVTGQLTTSTTGALSGTLSIQLLPEDGGTERLLLRLFEVPRVRAELLLRDLLGVTLKPFAGLDRDDTLWAYRYHECVLVERLRQSKPKVAALSTVADAIAALASPPQLFP